MQRFLPLETAKSDRVRDLRHLGRHLSSLLPLANADEALRMRFTCAKVTALMDDVAFDVSEAFTQVADEIFQEASRLVVEVELRLTKGLESYRLH